MGILHGNRRRVDPARRGPSELEHLPLLQHPRPVLLRRHLDLAHRGLAVARLQVRDEDLGGPAQFGQFVRKEAGTQVPGDGGYRAAPLSSREPTAGTAWLAGTAVILRMPSSTGSPTLIGQYRR